MPQSDTTDLYNRPLTGAYAKLCGGGQDNDGSMESCVGYQPLAGGGAEITDSKLGDDSPALRFTREELLNFAAQIPGLI